MNKRFYKKGDVPVMILVLGVFVVCALALLSFYFVKFDVLKDFQGYLVVEEANSFADEYYFYQNVGVNPQDAEKAANVQPCSGGKCVVVKKTFDGKDIVVAYPLR